MSKQRQYTITQNTPVAQGLWKMQLQGNTDGFAPGRFANLLVPGFYLRRPLAISDYDADGFTLYYKLVGGGTRALAQQPAGAVLDVLAPLGNGFALRQDETVLLAGGGAGVAPLYALAKQLAANGCRLRVALGFNTAAEAYLTKELGALAEGLEIATMDGTLGSCGHVGCLMEKLAPGCAYFYTCGPVPMMQTVSTALSLPGQVSLEERMACGFGGCVGCAIPTAGGMRRVCADGPVFDKEEMLWQQI